jgi:hypothetical protein
MGKLTGRVGANGYSVPLLSSSLRIPPLEACKYFVLIELRLSITLLTIFPGTSRFLDLHRPIGFLL